MKLLSNFITIFTMVIPIFGTAKTGGVQSKPLHVSAFTSIGSEGLGIGLKCKSYCLNSRYFYEYHEEPANNIYVYYHHPSLSLTKKIYQEEIGNIYAGIGYAGVWFKQKYFFPGTVNNTNYFITIPIGVEIIPFKRCRNISVVVESGLEFEHNLPFQIHPLIKGYDWQLNLARGIIDIRYTFGKMRN